MVIYNTSNLTAANTVYDINIAVNQIGDGNIGFIIVLGMTLILFMILASKFRFTSALTASTMAGFLLSIFLEAVNMVSGEFVLIMLSIWVASSAFIWLSDN